MNTLINSSQTTEMVSETEKQSTRRYDLDWLRVIAIVLLVFYHTGMIFVNDWGWHIKNNTTSEIFREWMFFLSRWRMALLFFISGTGTYYLLSMRTSGKYIWERFKRLFIPLVFGMLVIVPPQIYFERLTQGQTYSYLEFYKYVFQFEPYLKGNFSWHHLWFIAYLFIFSLVGLPIFLWWKSKSGKTFINSFSNLINKLSIYFLALPLILVYITLIDKYPGPQNIVKDLTMLIYYFLFFLFGYFVNLNTLWSDIEKNRKLSLKLAFFCLLFVNIIRWNDLDEPGSGWLFIFFRAILIFNAWCWVMAILGYGKKYLNFNNKFLIRANEGIYAFYILHQTIIVIIAYYVVKTNDEISTKFIFTSFVTIFLCLGSYEFLIRPYNTVRFLFGMKPKKI